MRNAANHHVVCIHKQYILVQVKAAVKLKPQAQQRCVKDSAEASLRAQLIENASLGQKMLFMNANRPGRR